jgi:hypothetical protein
MTIRHEQIDVPEMLKQCFGDTVTLIKDLQEHERVCTACRGLGCIKRDSPFALAEDKQRGHWTPGFPYHQEYVGPCPNCYNGIERLCEHCSEPLNRGYTSGTYWCNCQGADTERRRQADEKEQERVTAAKRVPIAEYAGEMLFDETHERFICVDDAYDDPDRLYYACDAHTNWLKPAADELLEQLDNTAAEEWEDFEGLDVSAEAKDALQNLLDKWFEEHIKLNTLYYADYNTIVVVPEEPAEATEGDT